MGQRLRELGIQADNAEILSTANKQIAAMNAEASILSDSITNILGTTKFNGLEVVDSAGTDAKAAIAYTGDAYDTTFTAGPATSIADTNLSTAAAATAAACSAAAAPGRGVVGWISPGVAQCSACFLDIQKGNP